MFIQDMEYDHMLKSKSKSRFEDIDSNKWGKQCRHSEHEPPMYICIPQGKVYVHECPACGAVTRMMPPQHTL